MAVGALEKRKMDIATFLNSRTADLGAVMPKVGLTPERLVKMALNAISANPKILDCNALSLFKCLVQSASLGLEPNTALGHAYLIPYKSTCQFIIGYKGYINLAGRSGEVRNVVGRCVYGGDNFKYSLGTDEHITHVPSPKAKHEDNNITHAYAIVFFKAGGSTFDVMTIDEINAIRKRSKAANSGPWVTDFAMMCRKTPIRRLMNYTPLSAETEKAACYENATDDGRQDLTPLTGMIDAEYTVPEPEPEKKTGLANKASDAAFKVECPENFDPKKMEDCTGCAKFIGCPQHEGDK
jgi:recombination protein RecT